MSIYLYVRMHVSVYNVFHFFMVYNPLKLFLNVLEILHMQTKHTACMSGFHVYLPVLTDIQAR